MAGGPKGNVGSFLLKKLAPKSIRQRHATGPQLNSRKTFNFKRGWHQLHRRISARSHDLAPNEPEKWHRHLPGDVRQAPSERFDPKERQDKAECAWEKRGRLQVFQIGGVSERFVCYRCGYPTKSKLQVIKDDNWDWRMCYTCYVSTVSNGMESDT
jgi:hypothetical protein